MSLLSVIKCKEGFKRCPKCETEKPLDKFGNSYCKSCQNTYNREYRRNISKEKEKWYRRTEDTQGQYKRRIYRKDILRQEMILAYGGACSCCGENDMHFLTLEHLEGGGNKHRREFKKASRTWQDLKNRSWPSGHTILCWNCQMGKTHYGVCPHKLLLKELLEVA